MKSFLPFCLLFICIACSSSGKTPVKESEGQKPAISPITSEAISGKIEKPLSGLKFQIMDEEDGPYLKQLVPATELVNIELFSDQINEIPELKKRGVFVVCYYSLSYESWRPDAKLYPKEAKGKKMDGWDELWPNLKSDKLHEFMDRRDQIAKSIGCDGVENDNMDNSGLDESETGFKMTKTDLINSAMRRAKSAHHYGLKFFAKNTPEISSELATFSDGVFIEECGKYNECQNYLPWIKLNRFVGMIEYSKSKCKPFKGASVHYHRKGYFDAKHLLCD